MIRAVGFRVSPAPPPLHAVLYTYRRNVLAVLHETWAVGPGSLNARVNHEKSALEYIII